MKDGKFDLKTFLDNIELYISAVLFIALTVLLFANVFCRYALKHSFAWVEEVATIAFVWMIWFAMSAAVTKRKHLRIDFILEMVPFKVKKAMLVISNLVFAAFDIYLLYIVMTIIRRAWKQPDHAAEASPADGILHHSYRVGAQCRKNRAGYHKTHA